MLSCASKRYLFIKKIVRKYGKYTTMEMRLPENEENTNLQELMEKYENKLQYNSLLENQYFSLGYHRSKVLEKKIEKKRDVVKQKLQSIEPLPLSLKLFADVETKPKPPEPPEETTTKKEIISFPYDNQENQFDINSNLENQQHDIGVEEEIRLRYEKLKEMKNWMTAYDNYKYNKIEDVDDEEDWKINYGTPDPSVGISDVPCGGCGAYLHCKDTAIPGYIPSEIFKNHRRMGGTNLEALICQRCHFLKNYNMALQVKVSPKDYTDILLKIRDKKALVVLLVDLTDFPCSIWPGIADIFGRNTPVIIAGNKIDLIPRDGDKYLTRIRQNLLDYCMLHGFGTKHILDVVLLSAKTGYGVEPLITRLYSIWGTKGDVYLVGCTNSGKSSLFNALLQSDYCKVQATDLIQRATTSLWPGTTLNLLKFPIMKTSGYRSLLRHQRLQEAMKIEQQENKIRRGKLSKFNSPKYATLIGHIGKSFKTMDDKETNDAFGVHINSNASGRVKMGINERHPDYIASRWCYDTPGVIQPDQIINMLTTDELMLTLPKRLIRPQTFCVKPGTSLFIAGLARLDYIEGASSIRLTVFRSEDLPITICDLEIAEQIYADFLGKDLFSVPENKSDRLEKWPGLEQARQFSVVGSSSDESTKDVVLSSAGWIAINLPHQEKSTFVAWTPEKRGCYIRDCLLPRAVLLRGKRKRSSPAYERHKFI